MPSPLIVPLVFLLLVANGTPLMAQKVLGKHFSYPVDGDHGFVDDGVCGPQFERPEGKGITVEVGAF